MSLPSLFLAAGFLLGLAAVVAFYAVELFAAAVVVLYTVELFAAVVMVLYAVELFAPAQRDERRRSGGD